MHLSLWLALPLLLAVAACGPPPATNQPHQQEVAVPPPLAPQAARLPDLPPDPRERVLALGLGMLLERQHLRHRPADDAISKAAFSQFMERLDGAKLFLLQEHVEALEPYADRMDDQLLRGDLALGRKGAALLQRRRHVVAELVRSILSKPFDLTLDEHLEISSDKREHVATEKELTDRWRKLLKLQALERMAQMAEEREALVKAASKPDATPAIKKKLAELPSNDEQREAKARAELTERFAARFVRLDDADPLEPASRFLNAMTAAYDPHTNYLAPAMKENFDIEMSGSLEGIGAVLSEDKHHIVVREIVPGGASWRQGKLAVGDLIVGVAQQGKAPVDVTDMPINKVVRMIRGRKGTVVRLTVRKPDGKVETIPITRDVIKIEAAYARGATVNLGDGHRPLGYISLPSFYGNIGSNRPAERNATTDMRKLLEHFERRKLQGVVVDLRGNGGGLLGHARDITGLLIETGPVVQTRYADGKVNVLRDEDPRVSFRGNVVVLVDRASASASEILAGALQDYGRALVVGTGPTHGKGTVQAMIPLDQLKRVPGGPPLGVVKITIQQYFRVAGDSTQWRGVVPDVLLPDPSAHIEAGERHLDHSIPWSEVAPLRFEPWKGSRWNIEALAAKSAKRHAAEPAFGKITARSAQLKARSDDTKVPLNKDRWLARRASYDKALAAVDPNFDEGAARQSVTVVDYAANAASPNTTSPKGDTAVDRGLDRWTQSLSRDPWLQEALFLLEDMRAR